MRFSRPAVRGRLFPFAFFALLACSGRRNHPEDRADAGTVPAPSAAPLSFVAHDGAFTATNEGQRLVSRVDAHGASLAPIAGEWQVGVHVTEVGRDGALRAVSPGVPRALDGRVRLARGAGVDEWFLHGAAGLEHGLDLASPPPGDGALVVEVAVDGLSPVLAGADVDLRDAHGRTVLRYGRLSAKDANGASLPARLAVERGSIVLRIVDAGARYPIVVDPLVWVAQQHLTAADGTTSAIFGNAVSVDVDTAIVGSGTEHVYVFTRAGTTWSQQGPRLGPTGGSTGDEFGASVAVSGDTAIVGAYYETVAAVKTGAAYVFARSGTTWAQQAGPFVGAGVPASAQFGQAVAIDGDTAVVGAPYDGDGAAYVFVRSGTTWSQQGSALVASDDVANAAFGSSVAIDGDTIVVGAPQQREAYVFVRGGTVWTQQDAPLASPDAAKGGEFGAAVAIDVDTIVVGASREDVGGNVHQGNAYVFVRAGATWSAQGGALPRIGGQEGDNFGFSVAVRANTAVVGAPGVDEAGSAPVPGSAYVFTRSGATWTQFGAALPRVSPTAPDIFGAHVSMSGATALVGALGEDVGANTAQGAADVYVVEHTLGDACAIASDCVSGFCVDGACCDSACTGVCMACSGAKKGGGVDGSCGAVLPRSDPDGDCVPYICGTGACSTSCNGDGDCAKSAYCAAHVCTPKHSNGTACGAGNECGSGFCTESVCCDTSCTSTCKSCLAARQTPGGKDGTCGSAAVGTDWRGDCPAPTCSSGTVTAASCDGAGSCSHIVTTPCAPSICNAGGDACLTHCTTDADCGISGFCDTDGTCSAKHGKAVACTASDQCTSGACSDGVCCDRACTNSCEACNEPGSGLAGTCVTIVGDPRPAHQACIGQGTACGGQCGGSAVCVYPSDRAACGDGCVGDQIATCDGQGGCKASTACPGNLTCASPNVCRTTCVSDIDCTGGFSCVSGACQPKNAHCSDDRSASISADGTTACAAYVCGANGVCLHACSSDADCAPQFQCGSSGTCEPVAAPSSGGGSGGCNVGEGPVEIPFGLAAMVALGLLRRRRA